MRRLDGFTANDPDFRYEIEFGQDTFPLPFSPPEDSLVTRSVIQAHRHVNGVAPSESKVLKFAASDASWLAHAGIPGLL